MFFWFRADITPRSITTNEESNNSSEWSSAIGPAMTGKSGRVIHNLQEDIARLTRECNLHRCRAEEAQRINEVLKQQLQNTTDRLRNSEQSHEANLNSIARKDRKIEDLKAEVQSEKNRRVQAEEDTHKTNQLAAQERDEHQRAFVEALETANRSQCQYDTLSQARTRDRNEYQSRFNTMRKELKELCTREAERQNDLRRLDVIIEQKNREINTGSERMDQFCALFHEYKEQSDKIVQDLLTKGQKNNTSIDDVLDEAKEATDKMKWIINVKKEVKGAE